MCPLELSKPSYADDAIDVAAKTQRAASPVVEQPYACRPLTGGRHMTYPVPLPAISTSPSESFEHTRPVIRITTPIPLAIPTQRAAISSFEEEIRMAKGQVRSNKEVRKPKKDKAPPVAAPTLGSKAVEASKQKKPQ